MTFCIGVLNEKQVIMAADSLQTVDNFDGITQYNNRYQKIFTDDRQRLIWSIAGLNSSKGLNYSYMICEIMRMQNAGIVDKVNFIKNMIAYPLKQQNENNLGTARIDLLIGCFDRNKPTLIRLSVVNGVFTGNEVYVLAYNGTPESIWTGMPFDGSNTEKEVLDLDKFIYAENKESSHLQHLQNIFEFVKKKPTSNGSIGGATATVILSLDGIATYVDGKEKKFEDYYGPQTRSSF